jgi:single-stranded DNA-specific DHH superfamily exonuclease
MSEYLWLAAVGMVSDYDLIDSSDIVAEIKKIYNSDIELYETIFGRIADAVSAVNATKYLQCENLVDLFVSSSGPEKILENHAVMNAYNEIEEELKKVMADFENSAERVGKTIFYNVKSKFNLRSPVSTKVSEQYPDNVVIIYQRAGSKIKASMRNQNGNFDLTILLKKAVEGIDATGGGHERAAGALISAKDWEVFKQRMTVQ